jgi:predicted DNA-binding WGR domain protein/cell wall assembly regulator SMI1
MARLTCTEGGSNKFWEGTVDGDTLTVRFGKLGTAGQTQTKKFDDAAEAEKELAKLIKQKLAKGYIETTSDAPARAGDSSAGDSSGQSKLASALKELDPLWKRKLPQVVSSLRPGLDASKHEGLAKILAGKKLPADIETWFAWHDGQSSGAPDLCDDNNYVMHSLDGACETWTFLNDNAEDVAGPVDPSWLPLFENGAGDHWVYDLTTGTLLSFFHDDEKRPQEYTSLLAWAVATSKSLAKAADARSQEVSLDDLAWKTAQKPRTEKDVTALAPGALFHYREEGSLGRSFETLLLKVKANDWLKSFSSTDVNAALQKLKEHLQKPPGKSSGYWKSDNIVFYALNHECSGSLRQAKLTLPG